MSRDKFISDDLYNMRERFKRSQTANLPGSVQYPEQNPPEESSSEIKTFSSHSEPHPQRQDAVPGPGQYPPHAPRLPKLQNPAVAVSSEHSREQRDLEGRLLRDLSFIEAEEKFTGMYSENLTGFRLIIERQLDELSRTDTLDERKLNQLRIEYFQASGRFEAAIMRSRNINHAAASSPVSQTAPQSPWPLAAAIVIGALTVSLTMLWLFGG